MNLSKFFFVFFFSLLLTFVLSVTYIADHWLGLGAYTVNFLLFSLVVSLFFGGWWKAALQKNSTAVGVLSFLLMVGILFLPTPSERILRSAMLKVPQGMEASAIPEIIEREYEGSGFRMPWIKIDEDRILVSLLTQEAGNCSAIIFRIANGKVVGREFSAD